MVCPAATAATAAAAAVNPYQVNSLHWIQEYPVNLDDAPKVERTYRSGDLHHERAQRATYSSETLENGSGYSR